MSEFSVFGASTVILIEDIEVPVRQGEYHTWGAQPTRFAIESGATRADHIIELPDVLEITWCVGNADDQINDNGDEGQGPALGTRAASVMDSLHEAIKRRELYDVVTQHRLYTSMAFTDARIDHVSPFTGQIFARVTFENMPQQTLERIKIPEEKIAEGRKKSGSTEKNAGRVDTKKPTNAQKGSVLGQVFGQKKAA